MAFFLIFQEWMRRKQVLQRSYQNTHLKWDTQGEGRILSQLKMKKAKRSGLKPLKFAAGKLMVSPS